MLNTSLRNANVLCLKSMRFSWDRLFPLDPIDMDVHGSRSDRADVTELEVKSDQASAEAVRQLT